MGWWSCDGWRLWRDHRILYQYSGSTGQEQQNKEINEIPTSSSFWQEDKKGKLTTADYGDSQEEKIYRN